MSGEEPLPVGDKTRGTKHKKTRSLVGDPSQSARILHQCHEVKNHTTRGSQINAPEGEFIEGFCGADFSPSWVGDRCSPEDWCSCSPVAVLRAVIVLSSGCPLCRARVRGLAG